MPSGVWAALAILGGVVTLALSPLVFLLLVAAVRPDSIQAALRLVLWPRYRIKVVGAEHLPRTGPVLVIANHVSWIDGFLLAAAVPRRGYALVNSAYLGLPIIGPLARRSGMIPVPERGPRAQRAMLRATFETLDRGVVLGLFPEAQVSRNGLMGPLYRGIEVIASGREHVPVVPAYLDNLWGSIFSFSGGRFFRKWPRGWRRTVVVAFGPLIDRPVTVHSARQAIVLASVDAFEARPPRDQSRMLETLEPTLPRLDHPVLGLLAASTPNFDRGGIRQTGQKPGSVGQAVPGVALRVVDDAGLPLTADADGRLQARIAGHPGWQDAAMAARIDREGFVFPAGAPGTAGYNAGGNPASSRS